MSTKYAVTVLYMRNKVRPPSGKFPCSEVMEG